jgi:N-acetylneuraminate synthase
LEPDEFRRLTVDCRDAWRALGEVSYRLQPAEKQNIVFRRSLYAVRDIAANEVLSLDNVRSIRPGHGLPPRHLPDVIGRRARGPIARGTPLAWQLFE